MQAGTIAAIWRYPVKSLRAEALARVRVESDGLAGDRAAALVVSAPLHARAGKPFRGKESARLHLTADPEVAASYAAEAGAAVALERERGRYFDARPVSVLFDRWVGDVEALVGAALDPLRWRPNLFVTAAPAFAAREHELLGATIEAGTTVLQVVDTIRRCVTPTYDIATGAAMPEVLGEVARRRDNVVGIYCEVVVAGDLAVGDRLIVLGAKAEA